MLVFPDERIHYVLEEEPTGVADALNLARVYNEDCQACSSTFQTTSPRLSLDAEIAQFSGKSSESPGCVLLARQRGTS